MGQGEVVVPITRKASKIEETAAVVASKVRSKSTERIEMNTNSLGLNLDESLSPIPKKETIESEPATASQTKTRLHAKERVQSMPKTEGFHQPFQEPLDVKVGRQKVENAK